MTRLHMNSPRADTGARESHPPAAAPQHEVTDGAIGSRLNHVLGGRWVDKCIAVVALLPFVYATWESVREGEVDVPRLGLILQLAVMVLTMALRRPPVRVTSNPLFWGLAFVATYWNFLVGGLYESGTQIGPTWLTNGVSLTALAVSLWARLSLGRNIGFVPAERAIVTTGAYGYVRHPIYSGMFVGVLATELYDFSVRNLVIDVVWCLLWVIKTFIEEGFLRGNQAYARYMQNVRWRWFPGLV